MSRRSKRRSRVQDAAVRQPQAAAPGAQAAAPGAQAAALGLQARATAQALDAFQNLLARTGLGSSSLEDGTAYPLTRFTLNFWGLVSLFESSWIARRIVEAPASDIVRAWPTVLGEVDPKGMARVDRAIRRTNTKGAVLEAQRWGRLFGGAGALIVIKGHENRLDEPLDLDEVPLGGYRGLSVFDRWSGIMPGAEVCDDVDRPLDVGLPEWYEVSAKGGSSFRVHSSRILRFCGPKMPEPENSVYSGWGISVLAPVLQALTSYDNVSANALSLSFRANIIGMREPELAQILSGANMNQKSAEQFAARMQSLNHLMSNQSLMLVGKDGELSNIQYSFSGLADIIQMFQLQLAGAAKMPPSLLWGRLYNGIGGDSGAGDEKIYEKTIASESDGTMRQPLEKLYPVIMTSELGEVPEDMDLSFPGTRVLDEKEKSDMAKTVVDTITVALNSGGISPRTYAKELKQSSAITGIFTNITDEDIAKLSDEVQSEGELGGDLFGGETEEGEEKAPNLTPSSSPAKVLKSAVREENEERKARAADARNYLDSSSINIDAERLANKIRRDAGLRPTDFLDSDDRKTLAERLVSLGYHPSAARSAAFKLSGLRANDADVYVVENDEEQQAVIKDGRFSGWTRAGRGTVVPRAEAEAVARACGGYAIPTVRGQNTVNRVTRYRGRLRDEDGPQAGPRRTVLGGMPVVIETPRGYERHGSAPDGTPWSIELPYDYGYFPGHAGADGDSLDVAVGPDPSSRWVYVFDQRHLPPKCGFDESKVFVHYPSQDAALRAFDAGHHRAKDVLMDWTPMRAEDFARWLKTRDPKKPCGLEARA